MLHRLVPAVAAGLIIAACTDGGETQPGETPATTTTEPAAEVTQPVGEIGETHVRWVSTMMGPTREDEIDGVAAGPDGSLWATGKFEVATTLGGMTLASAGMADIPLARFDPQGKPLWVQRFGGSGEDNFFDIDADESGAVATGIFEGTVEFGDVTLTSAGSWDCVVAAFDPNGAIRWATSFGGPERDGCNEVTIGANGDITTSLDTEGAWNSPAGDIPALGFPDTLLLRLDPGGNVRWGRRVGGDGRQRGKSLAVGPDGSVVFGGDTVGALEIDGETIAVPGANKDAWFSRWSSEGELEWTQTWGGPGADIVKGLAMSDDGIYAVGAYEGSLSIAGTDLDAGADADLAVVRFATDGQLRWAATVDTGVSATGAEIVLGPNGSVLVPGSPAAGTTIRVADGSSVPIDGVEDGTAWLARFDPDGSVAFARTIAGTGTANPDELARSSDRVYLDIVVRGADNRVAGELIEAGAKDGSVWALDLTD